MRVDCRYTASERLSWIFYSEGPLAACNPLILFRRVWNLALT